MPYHILQLYLCIVMQGRRGKESRKEGHLEKDNVASGLVIKNDKQELTDKGRCTYGSIKQAINIDEKPI